MARRQNARRPRTRRTRRTPARANRMRVGVNRSGFGPVGLLILRRIAAAVLPMGNASVQTLFELAFNLIQKVIQTIPYYTGAYSMIEVTPASFLRQSPLLASYSDQQYSFPSYPVSMMKLKIVITNTARTAIRAGRWAAVYIPYREEHDHNHYTALLARLTFQEVASMPNARVAVSTRNLVLTYSMRDKNDYCARPRQISEAIGVLLIIWDDDTRNSASYKESINGEDFNCDVEFQATMAPHVLFGPDRRSLFDKDTFKIKCLTDGTKVRVHKENGEVTFEPMDSLMKCDTSPLLIPSAHTTV